MMRMGLDGRAVRRPSFCWMVGVKRPLSKIGLSVGDASVLARDKNEWIEIVEM